MIRETLGLLACPMDKSPLELFDIGSTDTDVQEAVLYCHLCKRWFPILEGIPSLMPDKFRDPQQVNLLLRNSNKLPEQIVRNGKPFNISNTAGHPVELDAEVSEMRQRDKYAATRHPGRYGWQPENSTSLTETATFTRLLDVQQKDLVLDVGIGAGTAISRRLQRKHVRMIGIDFSFESLRVCIQRHNLDGENRLSVLQADALHLPFRPCIFDKVISSQVIQHLPTREDRGAAFGEIQHVLKEDGLFVFETLNERYVKRWLLGRIPRLRDRVEPKENTARPPNEIYLYLYSRSELKAQLAQYFDDVRVGGLFSFYLVSEFCRGLNHVERFLDRRLPSHWWAYALIAACRKKSEVPVSHVS